jgi:branched-chain amino acid transport system substrate-binding protein
MKKLLTCVLVLALAFSLFASGAEEKSNDGPIKIGSIMDLTGGASNMGRPHSWGVEYAIKKVNEAGGINGRQIELYTQDCKNDITEGLNAYHKLVDEIGVCAIIGPALSNPASAWVDLSAEDKIPIVGHFMDEVCTTNPDTGAVYPYMFLAEPSCSVQSFDMAAYAFAELGLKKFAVLYNPSNAFAKAHAEPFIDYVKEHGGEITAVETMGWADRDYSAQAIKITNSGAEAVFLCDYLAQNLISYDALRDAGFKGSILGANTLAPPLADQVKNEVYDVYFLQNYDMLNPNVGIINELVTAEMAATGTESPQCNVGFAWDAVQVLVEAMKKAKDPTDGEEVAKLLEQTSGVLLSSGDTITIDPATHRPNNMGMYIATYDADHNMVICGREDIY